ncbi:MAG: XRE family transcriptional regulator [Tissierellia bacterium]|nr:XRE family transcriptional regulator [Tissierellia bacterium]
MDIGLKLKNLRIRQNLTQEELAERSELTKGFISQLERNLTSPSVATLKDLLEALGTNLSDFFKEEKNEKITFTEDDFFESYNQDLSYLLEWIIPNAQKNRMEPVRITLDKGGKSKEIQPYEGEEFGYVLEGKVYLHTDLKSYFLQKGETFYFSSPGYHYLENQDTQKAIVLWISTPPNF